MRRIKLAFLYALLLLLLPTMTFAQNTVLAYGQGVTGQLSAAAPNATYNFNGAQGDIVTITMTATNGIEPTLTLISPSGQPAGIGTTIGSLSEISVRLTENGVYTIFAGRGASTADGTFIIQVTGKQYPIQILPGNAASFPLDTTTRANAYQISGNTITISNGGSQTSFTAELYNAAGQRITKVEGGIVASITITLPSPTETFIFVITMHGQIPTTFTIELNSTAIKPNNGVQQPPAAQTNGGVVPQVPPAVQTGVTGAICEIIAPAGGFNIRTGPDAIYAISGGVTPGSTVILNGAASGWYTTILPDGSTGWIAGSVVGTLPANCPALPVVIPPAPPTPTNTPTFTPSPTFTPTFTPTHTPTFTPSPTFTPTVTPSPTP